MKISILLPYKENFSPEYPGAVSLFVYETTKNSKYRKNIVIFGNTEYKKKFDLKYENIDLKRNIFKSLTKNYVKKFISIEKKINSSIIEVHNRPSYIHILYSETKNKILKHPLTESIRRVFFHLEIILGPTPRRYSCCLVNNSF